MSADAAAYLDAKQRGGIADLSARTKIRLTGADRIRYLNGQVTADVNRLTEHEALPACITTAKGKLSADVFISSAPQETAATASASLLVDAELELRESLLARIERYIIADDVTVEDVTEPLGLLHFLPAPDAGIDSLHGADLSQFQPVRVCRFGRVGLDLRIPSLAAPDLLRQLREHHALLDTSLLETLRIEAGIPRWGRELDEDTLPPEAGLDRTHIDYHKGCYIGQEVISRIKSVGHVNRRLTGFLSLDGAPLAPGMRLFTSADGAAKPAGTLTSAAWSFALSKPVALGYLKRGSPTDALFARPADREEPAVPVAPRELPFIP